MHSHPVCNECGGKGCDVCHDGWACIDDPNYKYADSHLDEECNKCKMGWKVGGSQSEK